MAAPHGPLSRLERLPDELLLGISEQPSLSVRDLVSLARASRPYSEIAISAAYKLHIKNEFGIAIYWAIEKGQYGTLKRLIDNGADVSMLNENGDLLDVDEILAKHNDLHHIWKHMNIDLVYQPRFSPLAVAAYHGRDSMVALLLDNGADPTGESTQLCGCCNLLLRCAENLPDCPTFWELSDRDDDGSYRPMEAYIHDSWWSPLHYAICRQHVSTAKLLLERGASARYVGRDGVTALHVATRWDAREIIDHLLDNNLVDINLQSERGVTALHLAYMGGEYDLVDDYLNNHGADTNLAYDDESGPWNIFSMACADGDFVRALEYLKKGADPQLVVVGDDGRDAWTVMRFIYGSSDNEVPSPLRKDDVRIELEQEIIARGRQETASDA
ncbi:hypothetical protein LA080_010468 [Diaporthe eres]|uniref:Ankyrin repeat protein n=1 Tax=Diaporthe vaccinii TaxID=105482 RepID=A0ABR4EAZ1_9PEZI|nr:hypothetical protein LA080_010468 [Diaporthe eres]